MTSFVNLLANDVWSDADILRRTEAMIRRDFSADEEAALNRKATGAALGAYVLTPVDIEDLERYSQVAENAKAEGDAARADMALLLQVFPVEDAERRLSQPEVEPEHDEDGNVTNQDAIDADLSERAAAQSVIDAASPEVMAIVEQRRPPDEPEAPVEEVTPEETV